MPEKPFAMLAKSFDCLLITRPLIEAQQLAGELADLPLKMVIQPAHEFRPVAIDSSEINRLQHSVRTKPSPLLVFTSPRAVQFALLQLPLSLLAACQWAAIGPSTAAALQAEGLKPIIQPSAGYTSEELLQRFDEIPLRANKAWIVAAAGGRTALLEGLRQRGISAEMLLAYERSAAPVAVENLYQLEQGGKILSLWSSENAMKQLAASLSASAWQQVCAGEWLVVSERLAGIAAAFQPASVHLSAGPGNEDLAKSIRRICFDL